ncbi:MAG TPA: outer membrane protein assembly factor BamA, partial [Stellaceae bacterium]|nr:outer membrane protein assembly factor BamA [Stellaceae bacterium]
MVFGVARRLSFAIALLFAAAIPVVAVIAQTSSGDIIQEIRVDGTQRVDPDTVKSYLQIQPGEAYDQQKADASLKALYATGLFSDVTMQRQGSALIVHVVENPVINRIQFEGNSKLTDDNLNQEVQLRPRLVFTREKVQADVVRILELYRRAGHFAATVQPKVIELPQNRVDLVFEIDEGPATGIRGITFLGNKEFSESTLRDVISTKESRWWRFLSNDDTYDPDRLTYDRELLRKFYLSQGYADFRVVSAIAELAPDRSGFLITFQIEEGQRYHFGKINLANELKDVDPATLKPLLTTSEGDWYN